MFDWLHYRYALARAQIAHRKQIKSLHVGGRIVIKSQGESREVVSERLNNMIEDHRAERAALQTRYLCNLATKRLIPIPEMSDGFRLGKPDPSSKWRNYEPLAVSVLTDDAIRELREQLGQHQSLFGHRVLLRASG